MQSIASTIIENRKNVMEVVKQKRKESYLLIVSEIFNASAKDFEEGNAEEMVWGLKVKKCMDMAIECFVDFGTANDSKFIHMYDLPGNMKNLKKALEPVKDLKPLKEVIDIIYDYFLNEKGFCVTRDEDSVTVSIDFTVCE